MQSWPNPSQDDGGGQDAWQSSFAFADQGAAFDPNQQWAQQMAGQTADFSHLHQDPAAFFDASSASSNPYMQAHGSPTNQPTFSTQPYGQQDQDAIDTAFHNVHPNLYAHGAKPNAGANTNQLDEGQAFAPHNYSFPPGNATFHQQPFTQSHLQQHPVNRQPEQYGAFPQTQQAAVQPQRVVTPQGAYRHSPGLVPPPTGQPAQYQTDPHMNYPAQRQPYQLQNEQVNSPQPQRQAYQDGIHTFQGQPTAVQQNATQQNIQYAVNAFSPLDATGLAAKKRKRTTKTPDSSSEATQDSVSDTPAKKVEDMDAYPVPVPSAEDQERLAKFSKRSKSAQVKYPSINGLPHLVFDGSMKMPAPKSFDKLAPLVTLPPRSGKAMVPELGYSLPCEIQGKFTSQYRPAPDRAGLNERRMEAKDLLDQFEGSMKAMGKRRPKYTEYPHAFKEQMKSDEAVRNKAGKKAKKELEGDQNKSIRSAVRPTDPVEAASWDAIGIVHLDQSVARTSSLIAQRVQQAGDLIIKLRGEMHKAKQELDQATKDKKLESEIVVIKANYEQRKEAFFRALDSIVEHADDAVLDNLGGHHKLILSLVNALIACVKAADFSGKLPKIVLELISLFRMTKKIVDTTNFETVRKRFGDKGDADVKEIIQDINAKIKKVMKVSESETATGYTGTSAASRAKAAAKSVTDTTIKRSREDDSDSRTSKKIVVEPPNSSSLLKKLAQPKAQPQAVPKPVASSILPGKSRPAAKPTTKLEGPASVGSPAASGDEKPKAPARKVSDSKSDLAKAPPPKSATSATSSALSGIASLLDSINAPKAEAAAAAMATKEAEVEDDTETPAEKAKRLRKLERRKLRVSWKPDHDLVQVKIFQKDANEDEGRAMNMIRDAADDKSEGMMLKQRVGMDEDDEDDDVPYQPWLGPVETDFSGLSAEIRSKNFVTRGGTVTFSTEEQKRIAEREQRELMAIYTDPGDIPPTPKSPPLESATSAIQGKVGQLPSEDAKFAEIQRRWADEQQMGVDQALLAAVQRLQAKQTPASKLDAILGRLRNSDPAVSASQSAAATAAAQQPISIAASNVPLITGLAAEEGILAWLRSDKIAVWRDPNPVHGDISRPHRYADASSQAAGHVIEAVAQYLQGKSYPANAPPDWMLQYEDKVKEWWFGYNKEAPARQRREEERRARAAAEAGPVAIAQGMQDWSYAQQQEFAPYMAILQQMNGGNAAVPPALPQQQSQMNDSQLQSILSAINQGPPQPSQSSGDAAYQMMLQMAQGQVSQQQAQQQPQSQASGGDRDHDWERDDDQEQDRGRGRDWDRDRGRGDGGREDPYRDNRNKKKATLPPHKPANKALIGTKACTFWQQGKCARGDMCTFRHD
ncbi:C-x8-C-x5-C-x3-H type zinc finger protein [Cordyceps fumosorosea ARSEF 2679]|uniref:C-x8-C-x5-C-x3-H type zinc finger protein n=1 Tax=Cordyceps fumosorosea (strain ARSEF 2679) TaxID=1081104 RepID=A0A167PQC5_CORFA|nr:C-x8-C-x5-C-x3-H type zinc finger protein [Cordyceps fumosorosea ARSEF 2679]OAA56918.1 C-x8-C-x5-C-x3-H type zinc finger protein [Cordyceps fumosorosea ARSEF 2679]